MLVFIAKLQSFATMSNQLSTTKVVRFDVFPSAKSKRHNETLEGGVGKGAGRDAGSSNVLGYSS